MMTIIEFHGGPVTRRSLDKKSKHDVISDALMAMDQCDRLRARLEQAEGGREFWEKSHRKVSRRLAAIERQVLWRNNVPYDANEWSIGWFKGEWAGIYDCWWVDSNLSCTNASEDYRPDERGPIWLPILDPEN